MSQRALLSILFLLSGYSALSYQVVWQRVLTQEIGVDAVSISFIAAIFLLGIGIGSYAHLLTRHWSVAEKRRAYVFLELGIGLFGLFSNDVLRAVNQMAPFGTSIGSQFLVNALILLPTTMAMGLTTPLILDLARSSDANVGRTVGLFYGNNIAGAAIGAIVSGLVMIELLGLRGVACVAAGVNFALAIAFWYVLRPKVDIAAQEQPADVDKSNRIGFSLSIAAFLFGFALITLQMAYFRTAFNNFQMYSFIFPCMLGVFLLAMAAGQHLFGQVADRAPKPLLAMALSLLAFVVALVAIYRIPIEWVQPIALSLRSYWTRFVLFAVIFAVPVAIGSGLFTMLVRYATARGGELGARFGRMMAFASFGNMAGALAAPLVLFAAIGTINVLLLSVAAYGAGLACVLFTAPRGERTTTPRFVVAAAALGSLLIPLGYFDQNRLFGRPDVRADHIGEDDVGLVSTFWYDQRQAVSIQVSRSGTSTIFHGPRAQQYSMSPLERLFPAGAGKEMLIIGLGGANYLPYLVNSDRIAKITVVELSAVVMKEVYENGTPAIRAALRSGKVRLVHGDGRRFLNLAARGGANFDIIQIGVFQPWMVGAANLYTVEIARTAKGLLRSGGLFVTLDLEPVAVTMSRVFPAAYSSPTDRYIYFTKQERPSPVTSLCLRTFGTEGPANTDDNPIAEYWMAGIISHGLAGMLERQALHYKHPC